MVDFGDKCVKNFTLSERAFEDTFISGGSTHLMNRFYKVELELTKAKISLLRAKIFDTLIL